MKSGLIIPLISLTVLSMSVFSVCCSSGPDVPTPIQGCLAIVSLIVLGMWMLFHMD